MTRFKITEHSWLGGVLNEVVNWVETEQEALIHMVKSEAHTVKVHDGDGVILHQIDKQPQATSGYSG
jgi:hypothetical protein